MFLFKNACNLLINKFQTRFGCFVWFCNGSLIVLLIHIVKIKINYLFVFCNSCPCILAFAVKVKLID